MRQTELQSDVCRGQHIWNMVANNLTVCVICGAIKDPTILDADHG